LRAQTMDDLTVEAVGEHEVARCQSVPHCWETGGVVR